MVSKSSAMGSPSKFERKSSQHCIMVIKGLTTMASIPMNKFPYGYTRFVVEGSAEFLLHTFQKLGVIFCDVKCIFPGGQFGLYASGKHITEMLEKVASWYPTPEPPTTTTTMTTPASVA
jgi:hypothetical protein